MCVCLSVCVCVRSGRSTGVKLMLIAQKRLKLRTSNLTQVFPGTVRTRPPKCFQKGAWPGSRDPLNFSAINADNSKTVKATDFKCDTSLPRDCPDTTPKNLKKGAWPGSRDPLFFRRWMLITQKRLKLWTIWHKCSQGSPDITSKKLSKRGHG